MARRCPFRFLPALALVALGAPARAQLLPVDDVTLTEESRLLASVARPFAWLGYAVDVDGDRLVTGTVGDDSSGTQGAVHVFERSGADWPQSAVLQAAGVAAQDYFAVALDGDTVLGGVSPLGVHVFANGPGGWSEQGVLAGPVAQSFGWCLALTGDTAFVGAPDLDPGAVFVFERNGGAWSPVQQLAASDAHVDDRFGWSVAVDADQLVVGALGGDGVQPDTGAAYVFQRAGSVWTEQAKLFAPFGQGSPSDEFGMDVAISADRLAVGAAAEDSAGPNVGAAYVFRHDRSGWNLEAFLFPDDAAPNAYFGGALALAGAKLVVGARQQDAPPLGNRGEAYVFERAGGLWIQRARLVAEGSTSNGLGTAVDFDGVTFAVGDPGDGTAAADAGAVQVYTWGAVPVVYCAGKPNSAGCVPFVAVAGRAAVGGGASFDVSARDVVPGEAGFLLYGLQEFDLGFHGGKLCVKPPLRRWLPPKTAAASGVPPCSGVLGADFNQRIRAGIDPALTAGASVHAQWFQRDPADPAGFGDGLTNAVRFLVRP